jgi:hypothetical protein
MNGRGAVAHGRYKTMAKKQPPEPEETPFDRFRNLAKKVISAPKPQAPAKRGRAKMRKRLNGRGS